MGRPQDFENERLCRTLEMLAEKYNRGGPSLVATELLEAARRLRLMENYKELSDLEREKVGGIV